MDYIKRFGRYRGFPSFPSYSMKMGEVLVATGSIAAGDLKLDYTSDNAFIEFGVDISAYHGSHKIVVTDSASKSATGYLHSVAPGGETLGGEILVNGDFRLALDGPLARAVR